MEKWEVGDIKLIAESFLYREQSTNWFSDGNHRVSNLLERRLLTKS